MDIDMEKRCNKRCQQLATLLEVPPLAVPYCRLMEEHMQQSPAASEAPVAPNPADHMDLRRRGYERLVQQWKRDLLQWHQRHFPGDEVR